MGRWCPLHNHTMFSLLDGVSKPKQIAKRCKELGYESCAVTDHGNVGVAVQFVSALKDKGIKPILGCELYLCKDKPQVKDQSNRALTHLPVLAKNMDGWKSLIKISSFSHDKDNFYYYPRIDLDNLSRFANGNLIAFSGHPGSDLADAIFTDPKRAYAQTDYELVRTQYVHPDWANRIRKVAGRYIEIFGKENFFLEIQVLDPENNPAALIAARALRWLSKKDKIQRVATADSHYPLREHASDQCILICSELKTTMKEMNRRLVNGDGEAMPFRSNFMGRDFHIPSIEDMEAFHRLAFEETDEEALVNAVRIADLCEDYDIRHAPILPSYPVPNGDSPDVYLRYLCQQGWRKKIGNRNTEYVERVERELGVVENAGLASYFLIVQDYCNWARSQGIIVGPGRGSGAGSLVSYLIGITSIDPIKYDLLFERFYNAGRNSPGHISLPDMDCDFEVEDRKRVIAYLKKKFGEDRVANIATFNSMKGRGALTDVLRTHNVPFEEVKRITSNIPEESRIAEELQAMKDKGEEPSIIRYALENDPESFRDWCILGEGEDVDGQKQYTFDGVYGPYFAQAIRLEGTKRNISMHAAGVVLSSTPLSEMCPLFYDEGIDGYIAGMEYPDLEGMGQPKFDILGVASLDKIQGFRSLLRYGYISKDDA